MLTLNEQAFGIGIVSICVLVIRKGKLRFGLDVCVEVLPVIFCDYCVIRLRFKYSQYYYTTAF